MVIITGSRWKLQGRYAGGEQVLGRFKAVRRKGPGGEGEPVRAAGAPGEAGQMQEEIEKTRQDVVLARLEVMSREQAGGVAADEGPGELGYRAGSAATGALGAAAEADSDRGGGGEGEPVEFESGGETAGVEATSRGDDAGGRFSLAEQIMAAARAEGAGAGGRAGPGERTKGAPMPPRLQGRNIPTGQQGREAPVEAGGCPVASGGEEVSAESPGLAERLDGGLTDDGPGAVDDELLEEIMTGIVRDHLAACRWRQSGRGERTRGRDGR